MVTFVVSPALSGPLGPDAPVRKLRSCNDLRDSPGGIRTPDHRFRSYTLGRMLCHRSSLYVALRPRDPESIWTRAPYLVVAARHSGPKVLCAFW
jgi:hypothetical protein